MPLRGPRAGFVKHVSQCLEGSVLCVLSKRLSESRLCVTLQTLCYRLLLL